MFDTREYHLSCINHTKAATLVYERYLVLMCYVHSHISRESPLRHVWMLLNLHATSRDLPACAELIDFRTAIHILVCISQMYVTPKGWLHLSRDCPLLTHIHASLSNKALRSHQPQHSTWGTVEAQTGHG